MPHCLGVYRYVFSPWVAHEHPFEEKEEKRGAKRQGARSSRESWCQGKPQKRLKHSEHSLKLKVKVFILNNRSPVRSNNRLFDTEELKDNL